MSYLNEIALERPVGTQNNTKINAYIREKSLINQLEVKTLDIDCFTWNKQESYFKINNEKFTIFPSPFSTNYKGKLSIVIVSNNQELEKTDCENKLLILVGEICKNPLMPKDFPLYYPEEDKYLIELIEKKNPAAILCFTGQHPMCGLNPFPLFEDGNFTIPSAYISSKYSQNLTNVFYGDLKICSEKIESKSEQLIIRKENTSKEKIIICAHMDTKYETNGAIDNAGGVACLLELESLLKNYNGRYCIEIIPFNGEEYYGISGQLKYMEYLQTISEKIKLVINIDAIGFKNSTLAVSKYNVSNCVEKKLEDIVNKDKKLNFGPEWIAGDHSMFAFQGIECIALTSSNLFEEVIPITHTNKDTVDLLDYSLVKECAKSIFEIIISL